MTLVELSGGAPAEVPGRWYWAVYTVPRQVGGMVACAQISSRLTSGLLQQAFPQSPKNCKSSGFRAHGFEMKVGEL